MSTAKALWLRQAEATRIAQVEVVVQVLAELGFLNERALDLDPGFVADCAVRNVTIDGCIEEATEREETPVRRAERPEKVELPESEIPVCPECGSPMVLRHGKYGDFWGCTQYVNGCRGKAKAVVIA